MSEKLKPAGISRRDFLKYAFAGGVAGGAAFKLGNFLADYFLIPKYRDERLKTLEELEQRGVQAVRATDEARYVNDAFEFDLKQIPESIVNSTVRLINQYQGSSEYSTLGTAVILENLTNVKFLLGITSGHVLEDEGNLVRIFMDQPQREQSPINVFESGQIITSIDRELDIGVFLFDYSQSNFPVVVEGLGVNQLIIGYESQENELLYTVAFPQDASHYGTFPVIAPVTIHPEGEIRDIYTETFLSSGASGAGFVTGEGKLIGVFSANSVWANRPLSLGGESSIGSMITPLPATVHNQIVEVITLAQDRN